MGAEEGTTEKCMCKHTSLPITLTVETQVHGNQHTPTPPQNAQLSVQIQAHKYTHTLSRH